MSTDIDALEAKYRKFAEAHGAASERYDVRATNRNHDKLAEVRRKLKACGAQAEAVLRRLMKDGCDSVALGAAVDSLRFAEKEALEVLDAIARKTGPVAFDAEMCAELWREGKLEIP